MISNNSNGKCNYCELRVLQQRLKFGIYSLTYFFKNLPDELKSLFREIEITDFLMTRTVLSINKMPIFILA